MHLPITSWASAGNLVWRWHTRGGGVGWGTCTRLDLQRRPSGPARHEVRVSLPSKPIGEWVSSTVSGPPLASTPWSVGRHTPMLQRHTHNARATGAEPPIRPACNSKGRIRRARATPTVARAFARAVATTRARARLRVLDEERCDALGVRLGGGAEQRRATMWRYAPARRHCEPSAARSARRWRLRPLHPQVHRLDAPQEEEASRPSRSPLAIVIHPLALTHTPPTLAAPAPAPYPSPSFA